MKKARYNPDRLKIRKKKNDRATEIESYLDHKMTKLNKEIARNVDENQNGDGEMLRELREGFEQDSHESLAKPKKKGKSKSKKVNFYPPSNQDSEGGGNGAPEQPQILYKSSSRGPYLPPRHPESHHRQISRIGGGNEYVPSRRNDSGSRRSMGCNSSVENYQRYYQDGRPDANILKDLSQTQSRIEPDIQMDMPLHAGQARRHETAGGGAGLVNELRVDPQNNNNREQDLMSKSRKHYNDYKEAQLRQKSQKQVNQFFEPQFIKENLPKNKTNGQSSDDEDDADQFQRIGFGVDDKTGQNNAEVKINYGMNWIAKPTKEGFLYFCIPGTNTYQWDFPKVYDPKTKQNKYLFTSHWEKKKTSFDKGARKFWQHKSNPNFKQTVKPHSQTYLIQAAIEGNLAFLELYTKFKGDLTVCDQSGRSALIHSISNGHIQFVKMLCEFNQVFKYQLEDPKSFTNIIELADRHGNTPLFIAIRVNNPKILDVLISYQCNLYHRRQNGNTCLHECAINSSVDCLTLLASFCGQDLFHVINKEGYCALDLALQQQGRGNSGTSEITIALQKIQRNLMYQNAVVDSNLAYVQQKKSKQPTTDRYKAPHDYEFENNRQWTQPMPKQRKAKTHRSTKGVKRSGRTQRDIPEDVSSLSSTSDIVRPKQNLRFKHPRKTQRHPSDSSSFTRSISQSSAGPSDESSGKRRHLPQRHDHLQYDGGYRASRPKLPRPQFSDDQNESFDERRYMNHVKNQRKERRQQKLQDEYVPSFKKFKEEVKSKRNKMAMRKREEDLDRDYQQMFEEQEMQAARHGTRGHFQGRGAQVTQRLSGRDEQRPGDAKSYYERMRHQKNHFAQAFGEESYFKGEDFDRVADKSKSKSKIILEQQSRMISQRQSRFEVPEDLGENDEIVREATRRLYSPTPEEDGGINRPSHTSQRSGLSKRPYEGEMYNSRFVNNTVLRSSNNFTIDDIEKQRFRVPRHRGSGEPEVESYDERQIERMRPRGTKVARSQSVKALRDQGYSIVEKAYKNTTSTLYTIGSYIYSGLSRMRDIINDPSYYYNSYAGGRLYRQSRAKSVHYQDTWMDRHQTHDLDYYPRDRQRQITRKKPSNDYSSYSDDIQSDPSQDQYFTAHGNGRSQSRMASRARSRTLQRAPQNIMNHPEFRNKYPRMRERQYSSDSSDDEDEEEYQQNHYNVKLFTPVTDQHDGSNRNQQQMEEQVVVLNEQKQSVSIQADSMIRKTKRKKVKTIKRSRIEASKHSIGVGSICIDDEINIEQTETIYETVNVQKLPVKKQQQINNETVQSIASQKLEHSRMISFQRQRRTGKRIGKKAQQNLMESKHFQSSDEEKLQIQQSIQLSEKIEPAPHYLKQEVNYLKVKDAYEKQDAKRISIELKKMKQLDDEQTKLLKRQQDRISAKSLQIIDNLENYDKPDIKASENEKKEQSTPTRQSTQINRKSLDAHANGSKLDNEVIDSSRDKADVKMPSSKKKTGTNDIDDFYNQLIANNLSTTKVEDQINDGKIQQLLAKVSKLDKDKQSSQQNRESILKQLYEGLDITEDPSLSKQLETLKNQDNKQILEDGLSFEGSDSEINFDINECNDSLRLFQEQDTITDLEEGAKLKKMQRPQVQKVEQLEFFGRYSDGADSLDMAVEGSWLNPVQNFGECLSDCTFILEQDKNAQALYGSQMNSNVFDKGQLMNSVNNYSYFSQNQGNTMKRSISNVNLSMGVGHQILTGLNHNNSGFGFVTSGPSLLTPNSPEKIKCPKRPLDPMRMSLKKPKIPQPSKERETPNQKDTQTKQIDSCKSQQVQSITGGRIAEFDDTGALSIQNQNDKIIPMINSDDDKQFEEIDEAAFNKIIEQNIKAIPKRRMPPHVRAARAKKRSESRNRKLQADQQKQDSIKDSKNNDDDSQKETEQVRQQPFRSLIKESQTILQTTECPSPARQMDQNSATHSSSPIPQSPNSSQSLQPGALTRISDELCPARVDQAICDNEDIGGHLVHLNETENDDGDDDMQPTEGCHVQVARNYAEVQEEGQSQQENEDQAELDEVPQIGLVQEPPMLEMIEEKSMETSTQIIVLKGNKFGQKKGIDDKPSHSARRYECDVDENSVLEKSQISAKTGPKPFQSITGAGIDNKIQEKSKLIDQSNPDNTEIDFNLTQNMTQMNVTSLNQTQIVKNTQLQPPNGKVFTQFEQIDEELNEGTDAVTRQQSDSFGPAGSFAESSQRLSMLKKLNIETQNLQIQEEEEQQVKPEDTKSNITPLKINDKTNLYGTFNPCSENASSDADVPKLKNKTSQALKCLMNKMPSYPSDLEPSKLQSHKAKGMLVDPAHVIGGLETQTISNSAKSPKDDNQMSQTDTNSILGKGMTTSSILGNLIAQRRPYTSEGESVQAHNMRKWQSLKPPKEGAKNLKLRLSSASRSRGSSQNNQNDNNNDNSQERKSDKISIKSSKKSNNFANFENQKTKEVQDDTDSLNNRVDEPQSQKEQQEEAPIPQNTTSKQALLAQKLQRLRRPASINHFQGPQSSRLNSTNLSNKKSIRDISYRNANTSAAGALGAGSHSILTDNSERLRENLEALRKSKQAKEARSLSKNQGEGQARRKYSRANTIKQ